MATAAAAAPGNDASIEEQRKAVPWTLHVGFFAMVIGMFMSILDVQIVASSIRQIQAGVSASGDEIAWVQTGYLVAEVVGIPLSGFLNRVFGLRRLFMLSCAAFTLSSVMCALSWDLDSLVFFRVVQGFVGAAMVPTTMAAAFTLFPGGRSMTQQVLIGMVATLAPSIGPTLGGWITGHLSWHWLFLVNVIPGFAAVVLVFMFIPRQHSEIHLLKRMDVLGLAAMATMLGCFEYLVDEGPGEGWFDSTEIKLLAGVCVVSAFVFISRSLSVKVPVVELRVFKDRNFAMGAVVGMVMGFILYGSVFALPLYLGQVRGYSALQIGEIMSVSGVAMFFGGPLGGFLTNRFDPRFALVLGLALITFGVYGNAHMTNETGFRELFWPQAARGLGLILLMVPTSNLALGFLPPQHVANASGIFTSLRNLGGAVGIAVLNTLMLYYRALHSQELSAAIDRNSPEVAAYIADATRRLSEAGAMDPQKMAFVELGMRVQKEAMVMTFNNLFMAMTMATIAVVVLVPFLRKPNAAPGGGPAH